MSADMPGAAAAWLDGDAGPLVRSYVLTGGRTRADEDLELLTHIVTTPSGSRRLAALTPEQRAIVTHAMRPTSVADLASRVGRPVTVIRVILADLLDEGAIAIEAPISLRRHPDDRVLGAVLDGLRSL
jgi:hypothetical protein